MPDPTRFWLGAVLGVTLATAVLTTVVICTVQLNHRDAIRAHAACARLGGEVVLGAEGEWRCECPREDR